MQLCRGCLVVQLVACCPRACGFCAGLLRLRWLVQSGALRLDHWVRIQNPRDLEKEKKVQCLASQQECPGFKSPSGQGHFRVFWLPPTAQRHIFGDRQIGVWEWMVVCSKLSCVRGVDDLSPEGRWDLLQLLPWSPNGGGCVDLKQQNLLNISLKDI